MKTLKFLHRLNRCRLKTLPVVSTPYIQALKRTQRQYFWSILFVSLAFGYYSYHFLEQRTQAQRLVPTVVSTKALSIGHQLTPADLQIIKKPHYQVSNKAYSSVENLLGKTLIQNVAVREGLVSVDVSAEQNPDSITAQFNGGWAFSLSEDWLVAPLPSLGAGDRVDVLVSNPKSSDELGIKLATDLTVIAVEPHRNRKNLIVQVTSPQAEALLSSRGLRLPMQILVRSSEFSNLSLSNDSNH